MCTYSNKYQSIIMEEWEALRTLIQMNDSRTTVVQLQVQNSTCIQIKVLSTKPTCLPKIVRGGEQLMNNDASN
jgi:hypothetical protein